MENDHKLNQSGSLRWTRQLEENCERHLLVRLGERYCLGSLEASCAVNDERKVLTILTTFQVWREYEKEVFGNIIGWDGSGFRLDMGIVTIRARWKSSATRGIGAVRKERNSVDFRKNTKSKNQMLIQIKLIFLYSRARTYIHLIWRPPHIRTYAFCSTNGLAVIESFEWKAVCMLKLNGLFLLTCKRKCYELFYGKQNQGQYPDAAKKNRNWMEQCQSIMGICNIYGSVTCKIGN